MAPKINAAAAALALVAGSASAQVQIGERFDDLRIITHHGCSGGTMEQRVLGRAALDRARVDIEDRVVVGVDRERNGLDIIFDLSPAVAADTDVVAALERAAARWEALVADPVIVLYAVDYTSNESFIAAASSAAFFVGPYADVINTIKARAGADTSAYVNALPTTPADFITDSGVLTDPTAQPNETLAVLKVWGSANPTDTSQADGSIVLNTDFTFDTDLSDGVAPGTIDLESVMVHELGHVFGFRSGVDFQPNFVSPTTLDQFRFGIGAAANTPTSLADIADPGFDREHRTGVEAALNTVGAVPSYTGGPIRFSTGRNGDGRQASHWIDDGRLGLAIPVGVMDPTAPLDALAPQGFFTDADKLAFRLIGWDIDITGTPPCGPDLTTTNTNPGDAGYGDADGTVDGADLAFYVEAWIAGSIGLADVTTTNTNPGDAGYGDADGVVDGADLAFYVESWLTGCP